MCANDDVGIPGTSEKGLDMAAALGAIAAIHLGLMLNVTAKDEIYARDFARNQCELSRLTIIY